jgi:nucleoside-diphosphate-sugar epimerase
MVIGNGMIAKKFSRYVDDDSRLIFASGVSNSSANDEAAFKRERDLLLEHLSLHTSATLIYFSTCSIYDPSLQQSPYVLHKIKMEELIKSVAGSFIIFRVSNPVGFTDNSHTLLNYFIAHIRQQQQFTVWKYASRNLIDIDDMYDICELIIQEGHWMNKIINVANPVNYPVTAIIEAVEQHFSVKGNYSLEEKGNSPLINTSDIQPLYGQLPISFDNNYLPRLLQKYYARQ